MLTLWSRCGPPPDGQGANMPWGRPYRRLAGLGRGLMACAGLLAVRRGLREAGVRHPRAPQELRREPHVSFLCPSPGSCRQLATAWDQRWALQNTCPHRSKIEGQGKGRGEPVHVPPGAAQGAVRRLLGRAEAHPDGRHRRRAGALLGARARRGARGGADGVPCRRGDACLGSLHPGTP